MSCTSDDCGGSPFARDFSRRELTGLTITAVANILSFAALFTVLVIVVRNIAWRIRNIRGNWREKLQVFHQPMDLLITSLFIADALQASGGVINLQWALDRRVEVGRLCDAQGILKVFGSTGVALSSLAIAVYTFLGLWANKTIKSKTITAGVLTILWAFIVVMAAVGFKNNPNFFAPTPYWCWIHGALVWKLFCEYFWLWFSLAISLITYTLLFLWMRGNVVVDDDQWWRVTFQSADRLHHDVMANRRHSLIMAAYPTLYAIGVLPLSVVRWLRFVQEHRYGMSTVPSAATFAVSTIFNLSGLFNVILLLTTRPESGLFGKAMFQPPGVPSGPSGPSEPKLEMTSTPVTPAPATPISASEAEEGHLPSS